MATRRELIAATGERYRSGERSERAAILDELVGLTGYHRKHAIRVLRRIPMKRNGSVRQRLYGEAVRQALLVLWEAADRICGKRLKALLPSLIDAMERHGHLALEVNVREQLLEVSAATIDRALEPARLAASQGRRRRAGMGSTIRRNVPVRTFLDWNDPPPGFFEVDLVEHCGGPKQDGNFVHTLVLTDIATGWTECVALPVREQTLVVEGFAKASADLPFRVLGLDTDNDSAFMNQTVLDYCASHRIEFTRSRAYKKNDQAWVEQKNGAIVRRLVGYGRLSGLEATRTLALLYASSRLYVNFFQPSFKLKSKIRTGAQVKKTYHAPLSPHGRLLAAESTTAEAKLRLHEQFRQLDPVLLLSKIRAAQQELVGLAANGGNDGVALHSDVKTFLESLSTAWKVGEVRPTHRRKPQTPRSWRTRIDPFENTWPRVQAWLESEPGVSAKDLMERLIAVFPELYVGTAQRRTLQRRVRAWRQERARELVFGTLPKLTADPEATTHGATS